MKRKYTWHLPLLLLVASAIGALARTNIADRTDQTTEHARQLVLQKLEAISNVNECRLAFDREKIDLGQVRATA